MQCSLLLVTRSRKMAAPICIARMLHYSLCGRWSTVVYSGVRYELTHISRLKGYLNPEKYTI